MLIGSDVSRASRSMTGMTRRNSSSERNVHGTRTRGFAADIQRIGTFFGQAQAVGDGRVERRVFAAVGKRIGRDVDDADDAGAIQREDAAGAVQLRGQIEHR